MTLTTQIKQIRPLDATAMVEAQTRWDNIAKPLHSLGLLEEAVVKIAGITGSATVDIREKVLFILCGDNGVVAQGVSQSSQEVTALVAERMSRGESCVCHMAKLANTKVIPVDVGCAREVVGLRNCAIRRGTGDISREPAMSREEAESGILLGISLVKEQKDLGVKLLVTGEMGIGNTTTSTAVLSALLGKDPADLTGTGAGLSSQGLARKKEVIAQALALHQINPQNVQNGQSNQDVLELLSKVGGLDLVGLCGVFLGGAIYRIPVVIDGLISATAALCAARLAPLAKEFMLPSHRSKEIACGFALEALGLVPLLHGEMALGEGTGGVALLPLLDMAVAVYTEMHDFQHLGIEAYQDLN